jgi:hypothetical protein
VPQNAVLWTHVSTVYSLNSIHLDGNRRDDFREARDVLMQARGGETIAAERLVSAKSQHTAILNSSGQPCPEAKFVLMDKDYVYPLKIGLNTIGRLTDNDVVVPDAYVSRRHCAVLVHMGDCCELHDVASKNGTFLNGAKISGPTRLHSGDEIRLCNRQLVFLTREQRPERPAEQLTRHDL